MSDLVTCTFVATGKKLEVQEWYDCKTCGQVGSAGCCAVCKDVCHAGHNLGPAKNSKFYCDCGVGKFKVKNGLCKCLTPTARLTASVPPVASPTPVAAAAPVVAPVVVPTTPSVNEAEITKMISSFTTLVNPLNSALSRKDLSSSNNWFNQVTNKLNEFKSKYETSGSPVAIKFINDSELLLAISQESIGNISIEKDIEAGIKEMTPMIKALEGGLSRKDIKSVQNWMNQLTVKFVPFNEKFINVKSSQAFIDQVNAIWLRVEAELGELIAEEEIEKATKEMEPMASALQGAMSRQDVKSAINWTNQLRAKLDQFKSKYFAYTQSVRVIESTTTILLNAESQFHDLIEEEKIEVATRELTPIINALKGALERQDIKSIINWNNNLTPKFKSFTDQFGANPLAIRVMQQVTDLLASINSQLGESLEEQTISETIQSLTIPLNALKGAFERKDLPSLANWKNQFTTRYQEFKTKYGNSKYSTSFISNADGVLSNVNNEMGPLLIEKELQDRVNVIKPQLNSLRGSFERKEIAAIIGKKNNLVSLLQQPLSQYPASELAKFSTFNECSELFKQIDSGLGQAIAEKEIEDAISTMTISKKALTGAMERKDINSCANWKRVLEQQFTPFLEKYQANPLSSRFIQEVSQQLSALDAEFGKDLLESTTKKLNDLQIKSQSITIKSSPDTSSTSTPSTSGASDNVELQCTNKLKSRLKQDFYTCLTCIRDTFDEKIVCPSCRDVCHAGHEMGPLFRAIGTCDCGDGKYDSQVGPCQCLSVKQYPRQEYQPAEWVKSIGMANDQEIKFITIFYAYLIKIENDFKDREDRGKKLDHIISLTSGVWDMGKQLGLDYQASNIKPFVEKIKQEFTKVYERVMIESWNMILSIEYQGKGNNNKVKGVKDSAKTADDADIYTRQSYLDYYDCLLPWLFIQGTPKGRELYQKSQTTYQENVTKVNEPIQHVYTTTDAAGKQVSQEFWNKFLEITKEPNPSFSLIEPIDALLKEYATKLDQYRECLENKLAARDYLEYLKSYKERQQAPDTYVKRFAFDKMDQDSLRCVFKKDWTRFFGYLNKLVSNAKDQSKKSGDSRYAYFANEFYQTAIARFKSTSIPLVNKYELKGKTEKSGPIIKELEQHIKTDPDVVAMTKNYTDLRSRRQKIYQQLTAIDKDFNKVLEDASTKFRQTTIQSFISSSKPTLHSTLDVNREIIPSIDKYKGKLIELRDFDTNPTTQGVFERPNGNWNVIWNDEIDGGKDYKELQDISNQLLSILMAKNEIPNEVSKTGKDQLNTYLINRKKVLKGTGKWSAIGKVVGIHNYETHHYTSSDSEIQLNTMIPKEAKNVSVKKVLSHITTTNERVHVNHHSFTVDKSVEHYTYSASYVLEKVGVTIDSDSIDCLYFGSVKGQSNSLSGIHQKLRDLLPK